MELNEIIESKKSSINNKHANFGKKDLKRFKRLGKDIIKQRKAMQHDNLDLFNENQLQFVQQLLNLASSDRWLSSVSVMDMVCDNWKLIRSQQTAAYILLIGLGIIGLKDLWATKKH